MSDIEMDLFEFAAQNPPQPPSPVPETASPGKTGPECQLSRAALQQAAGAFLVSLKPDAIAFNVPTRCSKYRASAAGFWKHSHRQGTMISRTALVVMYNDIDNCFADCAGKAERMAEVNRLQERCRELEAVIREEEPHLAAADDLFSEFRTWDYAASENREYQKLRRKLKKELDILSKGSKLERIRQAGVADQCYLAVPEELAVPDLIPTAWGIVGLSARLPRFKLLREAEIQDNVTPRMRAAFAFNIAAAGADAVRFTAGIDRDAALRRPPRRRGKIRSSR